MVQNIKKLLFSNSERYVFWIVDGCLLANIPIIRKDLAAANNIFGPILNALKRKMISHKNTEVPV